MWRELANITARTALYLLQKVPRNQERFLRAGKRHHTHLQDEQEGRSGKLSAYKPPFSRQEDFGENPSGNHGQAHGFTNGKLWLNNLRDCSEEVAGMVGKGRPVVIYFDFHKACYMMSLQPNW